MDERSVNIPLPSKTNTETRDPTGNVKEFHWNNLGPLARPMRSVRKRRGIPDDVITAKAVKEDREREKQEIREELEGRQVVAGGGVRGWRVEVSKKKSEGKNKPVKPAETTVEPLLEQQRRFAGVEYKIPEVEKPNVVVLTTEQTAETTKLMGKVADLKQRGLVSQGLDERAIPPDELKKLIAKFSLQAPAVKTETEKSLGQEDADPNAARQELIAATPELKEAKSGEAPKESQFEEIIPELEAAGVDIKDKNILDQIHETWNAINRGAIALKNEEERRNYLALLDQAAEREGKARFDKIWESDIGKALITASIGRGAVMIVALIPQLRVASKVAQALVAAQELSSVTSPQAKNIDNLTGLTYEVIFLGTTDSDLSVSAILKSIAGEITPDKFVELYHNATHLLEPAFDAFSEKIGLRKTRNVAPTSSSPTPLNQK